MDPSLRWDDALLCEEGCEHLQHVCVPKCLSGDASPRRACHIMGMIQRITCPCGAIYERREDKVTFRDKDSYDCRVCGETLDEWNGSRIPRYTLIQRPAEKPE